MPELIGSPTRITAVAVVIPVHDEQIRIGACVRSVRVALDAAREVRPEIATSLVVVCDRCHDRSEEVARGLLEPGHVIRDETGRGVGAVRAAGVEHALSRALATHDPSAVWVLNTDADTRVPADWVTRHLRLARAGAHAVAGLADLDPLEAPIGPAARRYDALVAAGIEGDRHRHVYGANLGVRADAYRAVGGFHSNRHAEDHDLCWRLETTGFSVVRTVHSTVLTSARLDGRADNGLATLLAGITSPDKPPTTSISPPAVRSKRVTPSHP